MNRPPEFDIEAIARESKEIRSFSVDLPEGLGDLAPAEFSGLQRLLPARPHRRRDGPAVRWRDIVDARPDGSGGARTDPTLVVTAGVHGDEYEGMEAIYRTYEALDPDTAERGLSWPCPSSP